VHELSHAADDANAAGPKVVAEQLDVGENTAYRAQARYLLGEIMDRSGPSRVWAISQAASKWTELVAFAVAIEARTDLTRFEPVFQSLQRAAPAAARLRADLARWVLTADPANVPVIERTFLAKIRQDYGVLRPEQNQILRDGLGGQSLFDWIKRPI
jgi:hypothetical protein